MIVISVALDCEAKPFIKEYKLERIKAPFPIYKNDLLVLVVTGIKSYSMTAIGYVFGKFSISSFINIGICGHKEKEVGTLVACHKIECDDNAIYPSPYLSSKLKPIQLKTVETVETTYPDDCVYDMEGYYVCFSASKFISIDQIICMKVVSDNLHTGIKQITKPFVTSLMSTLIPELNPLIEKKDGGLGELVPPNMKVRLSTTEKILLEKKLEKLLLLQSDSDLNFLETISCKHLLFKTIDQKLDRARLSF